MNLKSQVKDPRSSSTNMAEMKSVQLLLLVLPLTGVTAVAPYTWLVALLRVNALSGQT